jgi:hypothetical protein
VQAELEQVQVQRLMVAPLAQRGMEPVVGIPDGTIPGGIPGAIGTPGAEYPGIPGIIPVASRLVASRQHHSGGITPASQIAAAADTEDIQAGHESVPASLSGHHGHRHHLLRHHL